MANTQGFSPRRFSLQRLACALVGAVYLLLFGFLVWWIFLMLGVMPPLGRPW
jgi:biotin transporter BioY